MICPRCGVDVVKGGLCLDCREVTEERVLFAPVSQSNPRRAEILQLRERAIRDLHLNGLTDPELADRLGISARTVLRWRKRLHLSANVRAYRPRDSRGWFIKAS